MSCGGRLNRKWPSALIRKESFWLRGLSDEGETSPCAVRLVSIAPCTPTRHLLADARFIIETQPRPPACLAHRGRDERSSARTAIRGLLWPVGCGGRADRSRISVYRGPASAAAGGVPPPGRRGERRSDPVLPLAPRCHEMGGEGARAPTPQQKKRGCSPGGG